MPYRKFINIAVQEAKKSLCRHRVGAVIFNKSRFISKGHNYDLKSVRKLHPRFQKWKGSVHAEVDTIIKARRELKNFSILVVRINNQDEFRLAKPCIHCVAYLQHVGIKKVYYSTAYGFSCAVYGTKPD